MKFVGTLLSDRIEHHNVNLGMGEEDNWAGIGVFGTLFEELLCGDGSNRLEVGRKKRGKFWRGEGMALEKWDGILDLELTLT